MIFNGELNEKDYGKLALDITTIMGNARKNKSEIIKFSKKDSKKHNKKVRYLTHWFKDIEKLKSSQIECFESIGKKMIEILEDNRCNINIEPANTVDLVVINFSENDLLGKAHRKVTSTIKGLGAYSSKVPLPG